MIIEILIINGVEIERLPWFAASSLVSRRRALQLPLDPKFRATPALRPAFKSSVWKNGPGAREIWASKGHSEVRNDPGIRDPQLVCFAN